MKFSLTVVSLVLTCLLVSVASAGYVGPADWQSNPSFTHQEWEFTTGLPLYLPNGPNSDYVNPSGMPLATRMAGQWMDDLGEGRQGGWWFGSGTTTTLATIYIPNIADLELTKELWFQATIKTNDIDDIGVEMNVFDADGGLFTPTEFTIEPIETVSDGIWAYVTARYVRVPQPAWETIIINGMLGANENLWVDRIDVATRCVPEPATIALILGAGLLGLIGWRRRK